MDDLDALGSALRQELGSPPRHLREQQRRRLRHERRGAPPRLRPRLAVALTVVCALLGLGYFGAERMGRFASEQEAGAWLEAMTSELPYRAPDGSSIRLEVGSRGRFRRTADRAQFDLHGGRAVFEVAKHPGQDWTVVAGLYSVHVTGTRFAVGYREQTLDVWVEEGRVEVHMPQRAAPVVLEAGDHLRADGAKLTLEAPQAKPADDVGAVSEAREAQPQVDDPPDSTTLATASPPVSGGVPDWHTLYVQGQYSDALRVAKSSGFENLTQRLGSARLLDLADTARLGGDSGAALHALSVLQARFPRVAFARDCDFLMARLHIQRSETSSAIRRLTTYLERGETARYSLEALGRLVELESSGGDVEKARPLARRYLERAPYGPYHRLAESLLQQR